MARESKNTIKSARKNLIINGGMDYWQRRTQIQNSTPNAGTLLATPQYNSVDRYLVEWSATVDGNLALERTDLDVPSGEPNIKYSLRARGNTTAASNFRLVQRIESAVAKEAAGKNVTLSFWYKFDPATIDTNITNSFIRFSYAGGEDNWGLTETQVERLAVDGNLIFDGTWRKFTRTYTLPEAASAGLEVDLRIGLNASSNPTFLVTGMMLVEGDSAPEKFVRRAEDVNQELELCQRYFEKSYDIDVNPGSIDSNGTFQMTLPAGTTLSQSYSFHYKRKRVIPTPITYSATTGAANVVRSNDGGADRPVTYIFIGETSTLTNHTPSVSSRVIAFHWTVDAEL